MTYLKHSYSLVVIGVVIATLGASVALGAVDSLPFSNNDPGTTPPAPPSRPMAQNPSARQAAAFGAFRQQQDARDAAPGSLGRFIAHALASRYGVNAELARHGASAGPGSDVYLVPGNGVVCTIAVVGDGVGGGCVEDDAAADGQLVGTDSWQDAEGEPEHIVVSGASPDGVDSVVVMTATGRKLKVAVQDNVYATELYGDTPVSVSWSDSDGSHSEDVPYQAD